MPTPEYHALLSPSSAARWINCPASVRLGENVPKTTSRDAEKGRLAHSIAELKARKKFFPMSKRTFNSQLKKLQESEFYEKVMEGCTDLYVETLEQHAMSFKEPPLITLETEVPIGIITGEKKKDGTPAGGTADCIQIGEGVLWVTDYKNGSGIPVSAEDNPQMKLYALGALAFYRPFYGDTIQIVRMTIVQPALGGASTWEISREDLEAWGHDAVAPAAALALAGEGEQHPGEWCKSHFCPIRATCRTLANSALSLEEFKQALPPTLSPSEIGDVLTRGKILDSWYSQVEKYALNEMLAGREIPGWKLVESRSSRKWTGGPDAAFPELIAAGIAEAILYEREPITPPALQEAIGKEAYKELAEPFVTKMPGKPALAPESDNRPPYDAAAAAFREAPNG